MTNDTDFITTERDKIFVNKEQDGSYIACLVNSNGCIEGWRWGPTKDDAIRAIVRRCKVMGSQETNRLIKPLIIFSETHDDK